MYRFTATAILNAVRLLLCSVVLYAAMYGLVQGAYFFPAYEVYEDSVVLGDGFEHQAYFSELLGFPQNYVFSVSTTTEFSFILQIPSNDETANSRLGLILVKVNKRGPVTEIVRQMGGTVQWEPHNEIITNIDYLQYPLVTQELTPGDYFLEVNSPDNRGMYKLTINPKDSLNTANLLLSPYYTYKTYYFLGLPLLGLVTAPAMYIPLLIIFSLAAVVYFHKRRYKWHG